MERIGSQGKPSHPYRYNCPCASCAWAEEAAALDAEANRALTPSRRRWAKPFGVTPYLPGTDPLSMMARARVKAGDWSRPTYDSYRRWAMRPVSGLALADMLATATRCVTAVEKLQVAA